MSLYAFCRGPFVQVMDLHSLTISDVDLFNIAAAFPNLQHIDLRFSKVSNLL